MTDPHLTASLLPGLPDFLHPGDEDEAQYTEYHRFRRLAQELRSSDHLDGGLDNAADGQPDDAIEDGEPLTEAILFEQLADTWFTGDFPEFVYSCSPHRLELWASAVREIFAEDFAVALLKLAPDVVAWLASRSGLSPALVNRVAAFADLAGATDTNGGHRTGRFSYLTPVEE